MYQPSEHTSDTNRHLYGSSVTSGTQKGMLLWLGNEQHMNERKLNRVCVSVAYIYESGLGAWVSIHLKFN